VKATKTNIPSSAVKAIAIRARKNLAIRANAELALSLLQAAFNSGGFSSPANQPNVIGQVAELLAGCGWRFDVPQANH
jgi:hypothetical protein